MSELNRLDVEQELKVARRLLKSDEGKAALQDILVGSEPGRQVLESILGRKVKVGSDLPSGPVVAVLIPSHRQPAHETWHAIDEMVKFAGQSIDIINRPGVSASIVSWSRNQLVGDCYRDNVPFTHVLFVDDDAVPPHDAIMRLLAHGVDIVAGAMTVRKDPPTPNFRFFDEKDMTYRTAFEWPGEGLIGGLNVAVGTGFMLISRVALEKIGEYYLNCEFEKKYLGMSDEKAAAMSAGRRKSAAINFNRWWFELLKQPHGDGEFGEDISFCFKARECGISVWVDTSVRPGHIGNYPYSLDDYLPYQASILERERQQKTRKAVQEGAPKEGAPDMKISVLVPTRGRPENIKRLLVSLKETATVYPEVIIRYDNDDETRDELRAMLRDLTQPWLDAGEWEHPVTVIGGERTLMSKYWNECAEAATGDILMVAADDIVFQTKGWDRQVVSAFQHCEDRVLFVHGDDGHWGEEFGTHGFLHRDWVNEVGYLTPPCFSADWCDTWINEVADALGRRLYLPFKTEHLHPLFGKAELDQSHKDRLARGKKDKVAELYAAKADERKADIAKLRELILKRAKPDVA